MLNCYQSPDQDHLREALSRRKAIQEGPHFPPRKGPELLEKRPKSGLNRHNESIPNPVLAKDEFLTRPCRGHQGNHLHNRDGRICLRAQVRRPLKSPGDPWV